MSTNVPLQRIEVKSFVEDVSPALLATIEQEFERVSKMDPPQPTKAPAGSVSFDSISHLLNVI